MLVPGSAPSQATPATLFYPSASSAAAQSVNRATPASSRAPRRRETSPVSPGAIDPPQEAPPGKVFRKKARPLENKLTFCVQTDDENGGLQLDVARNDATQQVDRVVPTPAAARAEALPQTDVAVLSHPAPRRHLAPVRRSGK